MNTLSASPIALRPRSLASDYPTLASVLPDHDLPDSEQAAEEDTERPDFEARISRAFHVLALRWLDGLFARYEKATATCSRNRITVPPLSPQGFAVTLNTSGGRCRVLLGPCCAEFGSIIEATDYMAAAVSGELRLRVSLDRRPHTWSVERQLPDGSWEADPLSETWPEANRRPTGHSWYFRNEPESED